MAVDGRDRAYTHDTIVAVATPEGEGGLAVVRLSGVEAVAIAGAVFPNEEFRHSCLTHRAYYGLAVWPGDDGDASAVADGGNTAGDPLDEVVVLPMLSPRSYTGEDVVEFTCHGGMIPARRLVRACMAAGARPAGPGEFTRRAFLNGKLTLAQAEAVADLIHAEDELSASAALRQLRGGLDRQLLEIERPLRALLVELEGSLEFVDDEMISIDDTRVRDALDGALVKLSRLIAMSAAGRQLRHGIQVVLAGPPNVGKSSLMNALLGAERVIVDAEAGTTRDVVSECVSRAGFRFVLHDTAGLRRDAGRVESMGVDKAVDQLCLADIVLDLREAPLSQEGAGDESRSLPAGDQAAVLEVATKADLSTAGMPEIDGSGATRLATSAVTGQGIDLLWESIVAFADRGKLREVAAQGVVLNERHQYKLIKCRDSLRSLRDELDASNPAEEVIASLLASILAEFGEISGRVFTESLLDDIFGTFCVGK